MQPIIEIQITRFLLAYVLLVIVGIVLKVSKIDQTKELVYSSVRMSIQLILAGLILTYIFKNPHPLFTVAYVLAMVFFSIMRVFKKCPTLNKRFKVYVALSISLSGLFVLCYFIMVIVGQSIFNPQYTIAISGMLIGNSMTGVILGINTFLNAAADNKAKLQTLVNIGVAPKRILKPLVSDALRTAFLPLINSMVGMGIVSLPGMMTGQILSGTLPNTAILYQIAIMISIASSVVLTTFLALNFGYKTLIDKDQNIVAASRR
jgi:putative ABC transport system permease protein